jgi:hypothetical protein
MQNNLCVYEERKEFDELQKNWILEKKFSLILYIDNYKKNENVFL